MRILQTKGIVEAPYRGLIYPITVFWVYQQPHKERASDLARIEHLPVLTLAYCCVYSVVFDSQQFVF